MRKYETMYIINPSLEPDAIDQVVTRFEEVVKKTKGKVAKVDRWGMRKLAYPILNHNDGYYVVMDFEGEPETAAELNRVFKIADEIIRFMIIRPEK